MKPIILTILVLYCWIYFVASIPLQQKGLFARLIEPPPRNFGLTQQELEFLSTHPEEKCSQKNWQTNKHLCSACGNVPVEIYQNEAEGQQIDTKYLAGKTMEVTMSISQTREGYMEFRLCNNKFGSSVTHDCFDNNVFIIEEAQSSRVHVPPMAGNITLHLRIPPEVPCDRYTLQWKYVIGEEYDADCRQCETYVSCADVIIVDPSLSREIQKNSDTGINLRRKRQASEWMVPETSNQLQGQGSKLDIGFLRRADNKQAADDKSQNIIISKADMPAFTEPISISYERPVHEEKRFNIDGIADALSTSLGRQVFGTKKTDKNKYLPPATPEIISRNAPSGTARNNKPQNAISIGKTFFDLPDPHKDSFATIKQSHFKGVDVDAKSFPSSLATFLMAGGGSPSSSDKSTANTLLSSNDINGRKDEFSIHLPMGFQTINRQTAERQFDFKEPAVIIPVDVMRESTRVNDKQKNNNIRPEPGSPESRFKIDGLADALSTSLGRTVFNSPRKQSAIDSFPSPSSSQEKELSNVNNLAPKKLHQFFDLSSIDSKDIFVPHISFKNDAKNIVPDFSNSKGNNVAAFRVKSTTVQGSETPQKYAEGVAHPIGFQELNTQTEVKPFDTSSPSITVPTDGSPSASSTDAGLAAAIALSDGGVSDTAGDVVSGVKDAVAGAADAVADVASNVADSVSSTGDVLSDIASSATDTVSSLTDNLPSPDAVTDAASNAAEAVAGVADNIADTGLPDVIPSTDSVADAASTVVEAVSGAVDTISDSVPDAAGGITDTLSDAASSTADIVSGATDNMADAASSIGEAISGLQDNLPDIKPADSVSDAASSAAEVVSEVVDTVTDGTSDVASSVVENMASAGENILDGTDSLPAVVPAVTDGLDSVGDAVSDVASSAVDGLSDGVGEVISDITDSDSGALAAVAAVAENVGDASPVDSLTDAVPDSVGSVGEALSDAGSTVADVISEAVDDNKLISDDNKLIGDDASLIGDISIGTDSSLTEKVSDAVDTLKDTVSDLTDNSIVPDITDTSSDIVDNVGDAVSDTSDSLSSIIGETTSNVLDNIDSKPLDGVVDNVKDIVSDINDKRGDILVDNAAAAAAVLLAGSNSLRGGRTRASQAVNARANLFGNSATNSINSRLSLFQVPPSPFKEVKTGSRKLSMFSDLPPPPPPPSINLIKSSSMPEYFDKDRKDDLKLTSDSRSSSPNFINSFEKDDGRIKIDSKSDETKRPSIVSLSDSMVYVLAGDYGKYQLGLGKTISSDEKRLSSAATTSRGSEDRQLKLPGIGGLNNAAILAVSESSAVGDSLSEVLDKVGLDDTKDNLLETAVDAASGLRDSASDTVESVVDTITDTGDKINDIMSGDNNLLDKALDTDIGLKDTFENVGEAKSGSIRSLFDGTDDLSVKDTMSDIVDKTLEATSDVTDTAKDNTGDIVDTALDATRDVVDTSKDTVADVIDTAKDRAGDMVDVTGDIVDNTKDITGDIVDTAKDITGDIVDKAQDVTGDIVDNAGGVVSNVADKVSDITDTVKDARSNLVDSVSDGWDKVFSNIGEGVSNVRETASDVISKATDNLSDTSSNLKDSFSSVVDNTGDMVSGIADTASDMAGGLDSDKLRNLAVINSLQNRREFSRKQTVTETVLDNTASSTGKTLTPAFNLVTFFRNEANANAKPVTAAASSNTAVGQSIQGNLDSLFSVGSVSNAGARSNMDVTQSSQGNLNSLLSAGSSSNINTRSNTNQNRIQESVTSAVTGNTAGLTKPGVSVVMRNTGRTTPDSYNIWSWSVKHPLLDSRSTRKSETQNRRNSLTGTSSVLTINTRTSKENLMNPRNSVANMGFRRQTKSVTLPAENASPTTLQQFLLSGLRRSSGSSTIQTSSSQSSSVSRETRTSFQKTTSAADRMRAIGPADASSRVGMEVNTGFSRRRALGNQSPLDTAVGVQGVNYISVRNSNNLPIVGSRTTAEFRNRRNVLDTSSTGQTFGVKSRSAEPDVSSIINRPGFSDVQEIRPRNINFKASGQKGTSISSDSIHVQKSVSDIVGGSQTESNRMSLDNGPVSDLMIAKHSPIQAPGLCRSNEDFDCKASSSFHVVPGIDWWCVTNCRQGNCNKEQCKCHCVSKVDQTKRELLADDINRIISLQRQTEVTLRNVQFTNRGYKLAANMNCKPTKMYEPVADIDKWCNMICAMGKCPTHVCNCP